MNDMLLSETVREKRYKTYIQGAIVRSVASFVMWLYAIFALWIGEIQNFHFIWLSYSVLFIVLINPPTLFFVKRADNKKAYSRISLTINCSGTVKLAI